MFQRPHGHPSTSIARKPTSSHSWKASSAHGRSSASNVAMPALLRGRESLQKVIREVERLVERRHKDSFILAVCSHVVDSDEDAADPVHGNACIAQVEAVRRA